MREAKSCLETRPITGETSVHENELLNQQQGWIHSIARGGLAIIFAYHGLVPKLLGRQANEIAMLKDSGVPAESLSMVLIIFGLSELLFAVALIIFWRHRWPLLLCLGLMCLATLGVAVKSPRYIAAAFNPITLNIAVSCLTLIDLLILKRTKPIDPRTRGAHG